RLRHSLAGEILAVVPQQYGGELPGKARDLALRSRVKLHDLGGKDAQIEAVALDIGPQIEKEALTGEVPVEVLVGGHQIGSDAAGDRHQESLAVAHVAGVVGDGQPR